MYLPSEEITSIKGCPEFLEPSWSSTSCCWCWKLSFFAVPLRCTFCCCFRESNNVCMSKFSKCPGDFLGSVMKNWPVMYARMANEGVAQQVGGNR